MIAIVQIYIHIHKNVQVNIKINNFAQIRELKRAHAIAKHWMEQNNFKIYGTT
jgi:hypothetical protein